MCNGWAENVKTLRGKLYAEKIMMVGVEQITPMHFYQPLL
jgi:D-lyxose ketol-isomerase